jgi:hypothetical protein
MDVGAYGLHLRIIAAEQFTAAIGMAGRDPHREPLLPQAPNHTAAEKAGSAEHRNRPGHATTRRSHAAERRRRFSATNPLTRVRFRAADAIDGGAPIKMVSRSGTPI